MRTSCGYLTSLPNPLYLVLGEPLLRAVVELGRARAFMRGHGLRVFERTAIAEIGGDAGGTKCMIADRRHDAGGGRAPADHAPGVGLRLGCSVSTVALCRGLVRNNQPLRSSAMQAASM